MPLGSPEAVLIAMLEARIREHECYVHVAGITLNGNRTGVYAGIKLTHVDGVRCRAHITLFNGSGGSIPDVLGPDREHILRESAEPLQHVRFALRSGKPLHIDDDPHRMIIDIVLDPRLMAVFGTYVITCCLSSSCQVLLRRNRDDRSTCQSMT